MPRLPSLPEKAAFGDLFAAFPGHPETLMPFIDAVMRGPGAWDIAEREFIAGYVSALNACSYCTGAHVIYAEAFGIPADRLDAALNDLDGAGLDLKLTAVLRYVGQFNTLPHRVPQAELDAVLETGVSERAVYEALMIAGVYNMMNRVLEGTGVTFDPREDRSRHGLAKHAGDPRSHRYAAPKA